MKSAGALVGTDQPVEVLVKDRDPHIVDFFSQSDDPNRKTMRQIASSFAKYGKARLVATPRSARDRIRKETGQCEGRRPLHARLAEAVMLANKLHRAKPKTCCEGAYARSAMRWRPPDT